MKVPRQFLNPYWHCMLQCKTKIPSIPACAEEKRSEVFFRWESISTETKSQIEYNVFEFFHGSVCDGDDGDRVYDDVQIDHLYSIADHNLLDHYKTIVFAPLLIVFSAVAVLKRVISIPRIAIKTTCGVIEKVYSKIISIELFNCTVICIAIVIVIPMRLTEIVVGNFSNCPRIKTKVCICHIIVRYITVSSIALWNIKRKFLLNLFIYNFPYPVCPPRISNNEGLRLIAITDSN
ncbi:unnamed protein product [Adineta ricciae]|uniref:Uncharacterized protein n=1 Tax=Adineta ricciae TaxID=249248 RepID=A0A815QBS1_ADIRI|nr:unnamed protein product [Adineta ricciae]